MRGNKPLVKAESTLFNDWDDLRCPKHPADYSGLEMLLKNWAAGFNGHGIFKVCY